MHEASLTESLKYPPQLPDKASLFLDFDGTLVELAESPGAVTASERVLDIIKRADRVLQGKVAIVSGREVAFIREIVGLEQLAVAGSHGQELHMRDGRKTVPLSPPSISTVADQLEAQTEDRAGVLVERKLLGTALHYRMAPHAQEWCEDLAQSLAHEHGLHVQHGKMMIELRVPGHDKGDAIRQFLAEPEFQGSVPIFVGDDLTDEPAFEAAHQCGGWGVLVGPERRSAARYRLDDVDAVHSWLEQGLPV